MVHVNLPIRRDKDHAVITGVCAGVARRWGVDPNLIRIAVALLSLSSGLGLILYGLGVALIPPQGSAIAPIRRWIPALKNTSQAVLVGCCVAAGFILFGILGGWSGGSIFPVIILLVIWQVAFRHRGKPGTSQPETSAFERAAQAWQQRLLEQRRLAQGLPIATPAAEAPAVVPQNPTSHTPAVRRTRKISSWWIAVVLALVGFGVIAAIAPGLDGGESPSNLALLSCGWALIALGTTLMVSLKKCRPRLMMPLTAILLAATSALIVVRVLGPLP